jgi:2-methylcitrate dehydratase PrpD
MGLALELARRSVGLRYEDMPGDVLRWAKVAIADTVGCAIAGAAEDTAKIALRIAVGGAPGGPCTVLGTRDRLRPLDAAFANAVAGHALDFDDTSKSMAGHPTVIILPAVLALAEAIEASGKEVVEAYVVGLETATRIARGVNFFHYEKGWHPTATLGIFGAASGCARLLRLDEQQVAVALAACVSLACGVKSNFGTQIKPLHAGVAARGGMLAAQLAKEGYSASETAFEHPQGFLEVFNGAGNYDAARMLGNWGAPYDLLDPGISIKKYPCVYSVHAGVDAAVLLHEELGARVDDIRHVIVRMHRRRLLPHVRRMAQGALDAKFSLPYAIARALLDGRVSLDHFENDAWLDPQVRELMGRIGTEEHDDDANDYGADVVVELASGARVSRTVPVPLGHGPASPLPLAMLRTKFLDCAGRVLPRTQGESLFGLLQDLERVERIERVAALCAVRG